VWLILILYQVAVVAVSQTTHDDYLFRTYGVRANSENCSITHACLATSAATTFFPSIKINGVDYIDGGFGMNNPSITALRELESAEWLSRMDDAVEGVGCFVSVGAGIPTFNREKTTLKNLIIPKGITSMAKAASLCIQIATDCNKIHQSVRNRYSIYFSKISDISIISTILSPLLSLLVLLFLLPIILDLG
jgi:hypothetical protein